MDTLKITEAVNQFICSNLNNLKAWTTVDLQFYNPVDRESDCTQFDVEKLGTFDGVEELNQLFYDFCKENHINMNEIPKESFEVHFVRTADTYDELMELEAEEEGYSFREE